MIRTMGGLNMSGASTAGTVSSHCLCCLGVTSVALKQCFHTYTLLHLPLIDLGSKISTVVVRLNIRSTYCLFCIVHKTKISIPIA